jgi:hypothetical protein
MNHHQPRRYLRHHHHHHQDQIVCSFLCTFVWITILKNADIAGALHAQAHLMDHIQGFTQSHWMPPLVECLHHIASAATMVNKFE